MVILDVYLSYLSIHLAVVRLAGIVIWLELVPSGADRRKCGILRVMLMGRSFNPQDGVVHGGSGLVGCCPAFRNTLG